MTAGYAIDGGIETQVRNELYDALREAARLADAVGLWRNGEPFGDALRNTAEYLAWHGRQQESA